MSKKTNGPEYLLRALRGFSLTDEARSRMRADLATYADFHAPETSPKTTPRVPVVSPFMRLSPYFSKQAFSFVRIPAALLLVLLLAGGTAYASEGTLPGDALYTLKVKAVEPAEVALATSPEARAKVHADIAETRIEEASQLAVEQRLDAQTEMNLEQSFDEHVQAHLAAANELVAQGDATAALDAGSDLEAKLVAHEDILAQVDDHLARAGVTASTTRGVTEKFALALRLHHEAVRTARVALENALDDTATKSDALALVTKAEQNAAQSDQTASPAGVYVRAAEADTAIADAKEEIDSTFPGDAPNAFLKANEAARASEVVSTLIRHKAFLLKLGDNTGTTTATSTPDNTQDNPGDTNGNGDNGDAPDTGNQDGTDTQGE